MVRFVSVISFGFCVSNFSNIFQTCSVIMHQNEEFNQRFEHTYGFGKCIKVNIAGIPCMSSVTIFQSDHFVLSTNFLFKFNVSLPLVTGKLLQKTVDVNNVTYKLYNDCTTIVVQFACHIINIYRILKKLPGN